MKKEKLEIEIRSDDWNDIMNSYLHAACYKIQSCNSSLHHLLFMSFSRCLLQPRHSVLFVFIFFFISFFRCPLQPYLFIPAPFLSLSSGIPIQPHQPVIPSSIFILFSSAHRSSRIYLFFSAFSTDPSCRHTTPIFLHTPLFSLFFRDPIATVPFYSRVFLSLFPGTHNRSDLSFLPLFSLSFFLPPAAITPLCYSCIYLLFSL